MGNLFGKVISLGMDSILAYTDAQKKTKKARDVLRLIVMGNEVPVEEFIEMYNLRQYNFDSKQYDIKFMKRVDFEGAIILHNCTRDQYYIGISTRVFRKLDRLIRGYENQDVYADYQCGQQFKVNLIRLEDTPYNSVQELKESLLLKYGNYEANKSKDRKNIRLCNIVKKLFKFT